MSARLQYIHFTIKALFVSLLSRISLVRNRNPFNRLQYVCVRCLKNPQQVRSADDPAQDDDEYCRECVQELNREYSAVTAAQRQRRAAMLERAKALAAAEALRKIPETREERKEKTTNHRTGHVRAVQGVPMVEKDLELERLRQAASPKIGLIKVLKVLMPVTAFASIVMFGLALNFWAKPAQAMTATPAPELPVIAPVKSAKTEVKVDAESFKPGPIKSFEMTYGKKIGELAGYFKQYAKVDVLKMEPSDEHAVIRVLTDDESVQKLSELIRIHTRTEYNRGQKFFKDRVASLERYQAKQKAKLEERRLAAMKQQAAPEQVAVAEQDVPAKKP